MRRVCVSDEQFSASYLLQVLIIQIMKRPTLETRASGQNKPDRILSGYLQTLQALFEVSPQ